MADLRYKALLDDSDYRKKFAALQQDTGKDMSDMFDRVAKKSSKHMEDMIKRINAAVSKAASGTGSGGAGTATETNAAATATKALTARQKEAIETMKAERAAKLATIEAIRQARVAIEEEKKAIQTAKVEYEQGRKSINDYRLALLKANQATKERTASERAAKKALADNSEYQKLNRALGELRRQSKDVLAEMFRLERQGRKNSVAYQELANKARGLVAQTNFLDVGIKKIDTSLGLHQRHVGDYGRALDAVSPMFGRLNSQMAMMGVNLTELAASKNGFQQLGATLLSVGKGIGAFLLSPIGLAITAITGLFLLISRNFGTIKEFNSGLLNVSKTTGIAGRELTLLGDSLIGLSRQLQTVGTDKLLEYATVAGQLGVKGTKNILAFTEALAKLETASDISGEEGGAEIARLLTLVDGGVQNVKAFGDEIVNLGNNFAATEGEILGNAEAISQNVGIYRFGRQDVLAYATATKSVGLEAEVVGSTFSRVLGAWGKFISTGKGVEGVLKVVGGSASDLSKRFKADASGVFMDYIRGLNKVHQSGGDVNATLRATGVVAVRDQRVIASLASNGYAVLEDAMNKVREASGALDQEFATKAGSLEKQIGRIGIAWRNLVLDIENGEGVLGQATVRFADGLATIIDRMAKILNPTGWNEVAAGLTDFKLADQIREMNIAYRNASETMQSLSKFDISTANQDKLKEKYAELESVTAELSKQYEAYKKGVNEGVLTDAGTNKLSHFKETLDGLSGSMWQLKRNITDAPAPATTPTPTDTDNGPEDDKAKRAREAAIKSQRDMQRQIDEMNNASLRATLDKDAQEVASVKDKYRKIRQEIEAFRKDPKNKGFAVDASGLIAAESREVAEVTYKQDTSSLMKELAIQRQLWQDYEAWRMELGEDSAKERYAKELTVIDGFKERLQREIATLGGQLTASIMGGATSVTLTGAEQERLKQLQDLLNQINDQETKQRDANLKQALTQYASYEKKRLRLRKKAEEDMKGLDEAGRKRVLKHLEQDEKELMRLEIESNEQFQEFMKTVDKSGSSLALKALKHGKEFTLNLIDGMTGDPTAKAKLRKEFEEFFDEGISGVQQENWGNVVSLIEGFGQLVSMATQFDGTMSGTLKTIGGMVSQVGQLAQTLGQTLGKVGGGLSQTGGYGAIIGAVISVIGGVMEATEKAAERARQKYNADVDYSTDFQLKQLEAVTRALERQTQLIKEAYGVDRVQRWADVIESANASLSDTLKEFEGDQVDIAANRDQIFDIYRGRAALVKFQLTGNREYDELIELINKGADLPVALGANTPGKDANLFRKLMDLMNSGQLIPIEFGFSSVGEMKAEDVERLYKMIDEDKLDEATSRLAQNLITQFELTKNALNEMRAELTGTTFQSITDELVGMFRQGTVAAQDFANSFEKLMQNAILQSFKRKYLEEGMQEWYTQFADATKSDDELTKGEISDLQDQYNAVIENARKQFDLIKDATGVDFGNGTNAAQSGLRGGIERMTEQTASELTGLYRAMYDLTKSNGNQSLAIMNNQLTALNSINTNTANTVNRLDTAVTHLLVIANNTRPQSATNYTGRP